MFVHLIERTVADLLDAFGNALAARAATVAELMWIIGTVLLAMGKGAIVWWLTGSELCGFGTVVAVMSLSFVLRYFFDRPITLAFGAKFLLFSACVGATVLLWGWQSHAAALFFLAVCAAVVFYYHVLAPALCYVSYIRRAIEREEKNLQ